MKSFRISVAACLALALLATVVVAEDPFKSGPQVGEKIPGAFSPLNVNGDDAGTKRCLVCKNGLNPVVMIFAREVNEPVAALIKKVDEATAKHSDCRMGSFVVFCTDTEGLDKQLKEFADKKELKKVILSIDNPQGPDGYKVDKDADVTVVLYTKHQVKANHAFKKGQLKEGDVDKVVGDITKILPNSN